MYSAVYYTSDQPIVAPDRGVCIICLCIFDPSLLLYLENAAVFTQSFNQEAGLPKHINKAWHNAWRSRFLVDIVVSYYYFAGAAWPAATAVIIWVKSHMNNE